MDTAMSSTTGSLGMGTANILNVFPSIFCCSQIKTQAKFRATERHIRHCAFTIAGSNIPLGYGLREHTLQFFFCVRKVHAYDGQYEGRQFVSAVRKGHWDGGESWDYFHISPERMARSYGSKESFKKFGGSVEFGCEWHPLSRYLVEFWERSSGGGEGGMEEEHLKKCDRCMLFKPSREWVTGDPFIPFQDRCHECQVRKTFARHHGDLISTHNEMMECKEISREGEEWRSFLEGVWNDETVVRDEWEKEDDGKVTHFVPLREKLYEFRKWKASKEWQKWTQRTGESIKKTRKWVEELEEPMNVHNLVKQMLNSTFGAPVQEVVEFYDQRLSAEKGGSWRLRVG